MSAHVMKGCLPALLLGLSLSAAAQQPAKPLHVNPAARQASPLITETATAAPLKMPDVMWLHRDEALARLERLHLHVGSLGVSLGQGAMVVGQTPAPGQDVY